MTEQNITRELRIHLLTNPMCPISQHLPSIRARYTKKRAKIDTKTYQKPIPNPPRLERRRNLAAHARESPRSSRRVSLPRPAEPHCSREENTVHGALDDARAGDTGNAETRLTTEARSKCVLFFVNVGGRERDVRAIVGARALRAVAGDVAGLAAGVAGAGGRLRVTRA